MTRDEMLIGWLCILRHNFDNEFSMTVPDYVSDALISRGWLVKEDDAADWDGKWNAHITDAGIAITDINAADWCIGTALEVTE
jgi:hypothetical protein